MKKKGFTIIEIMGAVAVIGIIMVSAAVTYNRVWINHQTDVAEGDLRDFSSSLSSYMIDYGNIIAPDDINCETVITETVELLNKQYLSSELKIDKLADDKRSVNLSTKVKTDPWGNKYQVSVYTYNGDDAANPPGLVIISSNGKDGKSSRSTYKDENFGDDVIAVLEPK